MKKLVGRRKKGFRSERELVEKFKNIGLWSIRIPVSGVAQPLPDVILFHNGKIYGFEVKYVGKKRHIFYVKDFDNLQNWFNAMLQENFRANALLAVKFRGGKWRFYEVGPDLERIEVSINTGYTFSEICKKIKGEN